MVQKTLKYASVLDFYDAGSQLLLPKIAQKNADADSRSNGSNKSTHEQHSYNAMAKFEETMMLVSCRALR